MKNKWKDIKNNARIPEKAGFFSFLAHFMGAFLPTARKIWQEVQTILYFNEIGLIMQSMNGWEKAKKTKRIEDYGIQKCRVRKDVDIEEIDTDNDEVLP